MVAERHIVQAKLQIFALRSSTDAIKILYRESLTGI